MHSKGNALNKTQVRALDLRIFPEFFMSFYKAFITLLLLSLSIGAKATHNRAGEITYRHLGGFQYEVTIITYTKSDSPADRPELGISWGDGTLDTIPRVNGGGQGVIVLGFMKRNVYVGVHTYPGPAEYTLSFEDPNRNGGVVNIPNSVNIPFYVSTTLIINPFLGINNSVQLLNPPIDEACPNQIFIHNPGAFDPDGDSISYRLVECRGENGLIVPGFNQPLASGSFTMNEITGDLIWDTPLPNGLGEYNVAFVIEEWRQGILIGSVTRDMQINVVPCNNIPPEIEDLPDICVDAGTEIDFIVSATNPDNNPPQSLTISATGGPFGFPEPGTAEFVTLTSSTGSVSQNFNWPTNCSHVRLQPYYFSFKAIDNGDPGLATFKSMRVLVVAPAPENLTAESSTQGVNLNWGVSPCNEAAGYYVYRRSGSFPFDPGPCETGLPEFTGYQLIETINGVNQTSYIDAVEGLLPGNSYCYRVVAWFDDGAESYTSEEVCVELPETLPVITNVSIRNTDVTAGSIFVAWSRPDDIDTTFFTGPFFYELERLREDVNEYQVVAILENINDTTYIDSSGNFNTVNLDKTYRVALFEGEPGQQNAVGKGLSASSVYLSSSSSDNEIILTWEEDVPWLNTSYEVYRKDPGANEFEFIGSTVTTTYKDTGLSNGVEFCYQIKSIGAYSASGFIDPIENWSQEICSSAVDNVPPCKPTGDIQVSCDSLKSTVSWVIEDENCAEDVSKILIYYRAAGLEDSVLLVELSPSDPPIFEHFQTESVAGCYYISFVDSFLNQGLQEVLCADNCPVYELPNTFSPNGDEFNDLFGPFPYAFIESIDFKVFNRWGNEVFSTDNIDIEWNGKNQGTGDLLPDGVYYYICIVNEIRLVGIVPRTLKGTIQLFGIKQNSSE